MPLGASLEALPVNQIAAAITNHDEQIQSINATFSYLPLEV